MLYLTNRPTLAKTLFLSNKNNQLFISRIYSRTFSPHSLSSKETNLWLEHISLPKYPHIHHPLCLFNVLKLLLVLYLLTYCLPPPPTFLFPRDSSEDRLGLAYCPSQPSNLCPSLQGQAAHYLAMPSPQHCHSLLENDYWSKGLTRDVVSVFVGLKKKDQMW